ncbi:MAG: ComF family protein [Selenomonadaceae bacterium]|nr:ComF family protein [Selenomonadaceae bacterium]
MNFLRELWQAVIYFLFPPRCPNCREIVDERYQLCAACVKKILRVDFYDRKIPPLDEIFRVTKYRDGSRALLHKLKFDNNLGVVPALKKILDDVSECAEISKLLNDINFAVPVPLHQERLNERGFNQTEKIFGEWLAKKNLPLRNFLIRTQATPKLYKLGKAEREKVLSGAFAAKEKIDLRGKNILIVDDIFTTGTTCKECAKVLKSLGAAKISVLAFAADFDENFSADKQGR